MRAELVVGDDERRPEEDRVAIDAVRVAGTGVEEEPAARGRPENGLRHPSGPGEGLASGAVGDELDSDEQAPPADLPDGWMVADRTVEEIAKSLAFRCAGLDQVLVPRIRSTSSAAAAPAGACE